MTDEPAFPVDDCNRVQYTGLTKREYFAGLAIQGILSNSRIYEKAEELGESNNSYYNEASIASVKCADALLEALNESK